MRAVADSTELGMDCTFRLCMAWLTHMWLHVARLGCMSHTGLAPMQLCMVRLEPCSIPQQMQAETLLVQNKWTRTLF